MPIRKSQRLANPIKTLPDSVKLTDGKQYGIHDSNKKATTGNKETASLFVNTTAPKPKTFEGVLTSPTRYQRGSDSFERRQYPQAPQDCMHNAEQFLHSKELPLPNKKQYTLASKEKVTGQVLGDSEAKNIKTSQDAMEKNKKAVGVGANPKPGEAYGIIRQRAEPDVVQSPYHFAPVVARDGKQTLTVEQTAGRADAKTTNTAHPILDMYKVGDTKDSFQGRYGTKDGYGEDAIAIVAQKHGPETRDVTPEPSERPAKRRKLF